MKEPTYEQLPNGKRGYRSDPCFRYQHKKCKDPACRCSCHGEARRSAG